MICMKLVTFLESFVMFAENYNLLENELSNLMLDLFNGISKESSGSFLYVANVSIL